MAQSLELEGSHVDELLRACCDEHLPAVVLPSDGGRLCQARFSAIDDRGRAIYVDLLGAEPCEDLGRMFRCCVTFARGIRTWLFIGQIRSLDSGARPARLAVNVPSHIVGTDLRRSVRVSARDADDLAVHAEDDQGTARPVSAVDVSLGGMLLEFAEGETPPPVDAQLQVELRLANETVKVEGKVRHVAESRCGVAFVDGDNRHPYREIVGALERRWFRSFDGERERRMPGERRIFLRRSVKLQARIRVVVEGDSIEQMELTETSDALIRDLGTEGVGLLTRESSALSTSGRIYLQWEIGDRPIRAAAQLVWSERDPGDQQRLQVGVRFCEMSDSDREVLRSFLEAPPRAS